MRAHHSVGSWHWCHNISAEAVAINDDGREDTADHLKILVKDTDGEKHEALTVFLPITLARQFAKAINDVSATQIAVGVPTTDAEEVT